MSAQYAVIRTGGKQYKVTPGNRVQVEKLAEKAGESVSFKDVLLVKEGDALKAGQPALAGAEVTGEVTRQLRTKKVLVFKKRPKKGYKKLQGHRQDMTEVLIKNIRVGA